MVTTFPGLDVFIYIDRQHDGLPGQAFVWATRAAPEMATQPLMYHIEKSDKAFLAANRLFDGQVFLSSLGDG